MPVKSKVEILQNFGAFSEYLNFKKYFLHLDTKIIWISSNQFQKPTHLPFPHAYVIYEPIFPQVVKFIYSEKAPKFCKIFTLLLTGTT